MAQLWEQILNIGKTNPIQELADLPLWQKILNGKYQPTAQLTQPAETPLWQKILNSQSLKTASYFPGELKNTMTGIGNKMFGASKAITQEFINPQQKYIDRGLTPEQVKIELGKEAVYNVMGATSPLKRVGGNIVRGLVDDISKAKTSGQSFDEWVKGQGKEIYHSTDSETFNVFDPAQAMKGEAFFNPLGDGLFLSSNKNFTRRFGKNTYEYILPKDTKTKIITDIKFAQTEYPAAVKGTLKKLGIKYDDLDLDDKVMINRLVGNNPPIQALNEVEFFIKEDIAPKFGIKPKPNQVKDIMQGIMTERNAPYDAVIYRSTDYEIENADEIIIPKGKVSTLKTRSQLRAEWESIRNTGQLKK